MTQPRRTSVGEHCTLEWFGETAVLVRGPDSDQSLWRRLHRTAEVLRGMNFDWCTGANAAYSTLLVQINPLATTFAMVANSIDEAFAQSHDALALEPKHFSIPLVYGGHYGPDLAEVCRQLNEDQEEVIRRHTSVEWVVYIVGAFVGAPQLGGPPLANPIRRLAVPRPRVMPGSVAVAGHLSHIYPVPAPGGWQIIGRTPTNIIDLKTFSPLPYRPGDIFHFRAIHPDEFDGEPTALKEITDERV